MYNVFPKCMTLCFD